MKKINSVSLEWAIEVVGNKSKYTMREVNKLINHSVFTFDGLISEAKAIEVIIQVSEHLGTSVSQSLEQKYFDNPPSQQIIDELIAEQAVQAETQEPEEVDINKKRQARGADCVKIHHYVREGDKVIFYLDTHCKKKRNKRFTGLLKNYDYSTRTYHNLDKSFSRA